MTRPGGFTTHTQGVERLLLLLQVPRRRHCWTASICRWKEYIYRETGQATSHTASSAFRKVNRSTGWCVALHSGTRQTKCAKTSHPNCRVWQHNSGSMSQHQVNLTSAHPSPNGCNVFQLSSLAGVWGRVAHLVMDTFSKRT